MFLDNKYTGWYNAIISKAKFKVQAEPLKCGDSNSGKTWKLINSKRVWLTKEK